MQKLSFLLVSILFVSGCTTLTSGSGVVIEDFGPEFSSVYGKEPVRFDIKVRNTGSLDSPGGEVVVLGIGDWTQTFGQTCTIPNLLGVDQQTGMPGESFLCPTIEFIAPEVPQGIPVTYNPTARIYYTYSTITLKKITLGTREELKRMENSGGSLSADISTTTQSPVSITVETEGPIRVLTNSVSFPVKITVTNTGGGVVCKDDYKLCPNSHSWNILKIETKMNNAIVRECSKELTLSTNTNTIVCQAQIYDIPHTGILQKTISVESTYGYFLDKETSVTVN